VIEGLEVLSQSNTCENVDFTSGVPAEPMLLYLAIGGRWVMVDSTPQGNVWEWQATMPLEGAIINGEARVVGTALDIETTVNVPRSSSSIVPSPTQGHAIALTALIPLFPLAAKITSRKRRRILLLIITACVLLLTAQSCDVWGNMYGHYSFPIPENGFPCEVPADNPNLAEMPGSTGNFEFTLYSADDEGNVQKCITRATVSGLGILKRDGYYNEDMLEE
jgi:hypothetical protein